MRSGPDHTDPETLATVSDTLAVDADDDPAGWSPPDRPRAANDWGTTAREEESGESLDGRLARELPDGVGADGEGNGSGDGLGDGLGDAADTDGELIDDEVGDERAGRLADGDDGGLVDRDDQLYAEDEGIDGGAASAEEAAVHVVRD